MSFSSEIKQELNKNTKLSNKELVKYELIGYLISGNIDILERNIIRFSTESDYNINRFSKLLYNLKIEHNIEISGKNFIVSFKKNSIQEFVKIDEKQIFLKGNIQYEKNEENLKTLVIGVFMGSGSINNPEKKYHLEIIFGNEENLKEIRKILEKLGIKYSYSKKGYPYDNASMESFNAILKKEEVNVNNYETFDSAKLAIFEFIESWYNNQRYIVL